MRIQCGWESLGWGDALRSTDPRFAGSNGHGSHGLTYLSIKQCNTKMIETKFHSVIVTAMCHLVLVSCTSTSMYKSQPRIDVFSSTHPCLEFACCDFCYRQGENRLPRLQFSVAAARAASEQTNVRRNLPYHRSSSASSHVSARKVEIRTPKTHAKSFATQVSPDSPLRIFLNSFARSEEHRHEFTERRP